jgi:hypothetical protein
MIMVVMMVMGDDGDINGTAFTDIFFASSCHPRVTPGQRDAPAHSGKGMIIIWLCWIR